jgi:glycosyltransferase involved in cell wall biosynthesis
MKSPRVSLCMIVKNEASTLPRCLASVAGAVDEIVVVDTGSSDGTPSLAQGLGARVYHAPWTDDFSAPRNAAMDRAKGDWVLALDADEELSPESPRLVREAVASGAADAFRLAIKNLLPPTELTSSADTRAVRLYRRSPAFRYEWPIHEQIRPSIDRARGRVLDCDASIIHYGYLEASAQGASRVERNRRILEARLQRDPFDTWASYHLGFTLKMAGDNLAARRHLREAVGREGSGLDSDAKARAYTALAQIDLALGRNEPAVKSARRALALDPSNVVAAHILALALYFSGDVRAAAVVLDLVRKGASTSPERSAEIERVLALISSAA